MNGLLAAGLLPLLAVLGLNRLIHRSLAAPRVPEVGEPEGLPWQAVRIATLRGLFAALEGGQCEFLCEYQDEIDEVYHGLFEKRI